MATPYTPRDESWASAPRSMSMAGAVKAVLGKYATFSGRARRAEFWWYYLALALFGVVLTVITLLVARPGTGQDGGLVLGGGYLVMSAISGLFSLAVIVPTVAAMTRRLHDTNRSGLWILIAFVPVVGAVLLLVFLALDGDAQPNRFGANPKVGAAGTQPLPAMPPA